MPRPTPKTRPERRAEAAKRLKTRSVCGIRRALLVPSKEERERLARDVDKYDGQVRANLAAYQQVMIIAEGKATFAELEKDYAAHIQWPAPSCKLQWGR